MPISQQGAINTTALIVPDLYVQIVPPQNLVLNGVPSNRIGVVGTAQWGPKNQAVIVGNMAQFAANFGAIQNRTYDVGTHVAVAVQQGASDFRCVRVTDGTDVAATSVIGSTNATLTAIYTGTLGNSLVWTIATGSKNGSWKIVLALPGLPPEAYDNLTGTGNAFWVNLCSAINNGQSVSRGPSNLVTAAAGSGTTAAAAANGTFTGGTDGASGVSSTTLLGTDGLTRTGMYALRGSGASILDIADCSTTTAWATIDAFAQSEGMYAMQTTAAGLQNTIANGTTGSVDLKVAAGLDSYTTKLMHGDWIWWNDTVNNAVRLVSPQGFEAGRLANLSPNNSSLNKPIAGVVGSQKSGIAGSGTMGVYSSADLAALIGAGLDVITNPVPGGNYWGGRAGVNTSSNAAINGDNYTRMTNYIAATLNSGMGKYVGLPITTELFRNIRGTLLSFLGNLLQQGLLSSVNGIPYTVVCDLTNNPLSRTSLGYVQADVSVQYESINRFFIVNLLGGQTVVIQQSATPNQ